MGAAAIAILVRKERQIVDAYRSAGATEPVHARAPDSLGVPERLAFRRLRQRAVLRETTPGHYYLDEPSWQATIHMRRRMGFAMLGVVVVAAVFTWIATLTR